MQCASCGKLMTAGDVKCAKCGAAMTSEGEAWKCSPCDSSVEMAEAKCEACLST